MSVTTLTDSPQGCGCAACQAAAKAALSSDYTGVATGTITEANSLYSGYRWGVGTSGIILNYKFFTALPSYYSSSDDEANNFQGFNAQMKSATVRVLEQIESFTNINFVETTGSTTHLGFAQASLPSGIGAWAYYPSSNALGGDVWTNNIYADTQTPVEGNYGFYTLMHEIGHALGLQHSFTAGLTGDEASSRYSVMAYDWSPFFSSSYMVYDIAALQNIYGANLSYHTGADIYATSATAAYTIWDAGGTDTLDASAQNGAVTLDLREGEYSSVGLTRNIGIAYGAVIENATGGTGNDILIGNATNNLLVGNDGGDVFIGSNGTDSIDGGIGTDLLVFDAVITNFFMTLIDAVTLTIQDLTGLYGTTTAMNVETFEFANVDYSFLDLAGMNGTLGGIQMLDNVDINVMSTLKVKGVNKNFWTGISSSLEAIENYQASEFRYRFSDNILTTDRNNNSGHDSLSISALAGFEGYVRAVSITDIADIEELHFTNINNLTLRDADTTENLSVDIDGGYALDLLTGTGNDSVDVLSSAVGKTKASYSISTGLGDDTVHVEGASVKMGVTISGGDGNDTLSVTMNAGARINGEAGNDAINGGDGGDSLSGGDGNDTIHGGNNNDSIDGGAGNDVLYGDYGSDTLVGGLGADVFMFEHTATNERDTIRDFNAVEDVIDISAILTGYDPLSDLINDFVSIATNRKGTYLQIDMDGTDTANSLVTIAQVNGLRGQDVDDLITSGHLIIA
jgi:Ca2+-binding RTX toxin-like protein